MAEYPKSVRVKDEMLIERVRSLGRCMMSGRGACWGGLDVHHIQSRGSGGGNLEDNLVLLCRKHHNLAHMGQISREELRRARERDAYLHSYFPE